MSVIKSEFLLPTFEWLSWDDGWPSKVSSLSFNYSSRETQGSLGNQHRSRVSRDDCLGERQSGKKPLSPSRETTQRTKRGTTKEKFSDSYWFEHRESEYTWSHVVVKFKPWVETSHHRTCVIVRTGVSEEKNVRKEGSLVCREYGSI